jgi:hypothetical protein
MYVGSDQLQSLLMARRLVLLTRQLENHRQNPDAEPRSFKEILDKDEIQLSGGMETTSPAAEQKTNSGNLEKPENQISELSKRLVELRSGIPSEGSSFEKMA